MIRFQSPWLAVFLLLCTLSCVPLYRRLRRRSRLPLALGPEGGQAFSAPSSLKFLHGLLVFIEISALLLFLFVSATPLRYKSRVIQLDRGSDIVFALDCSPSMSALDMDGESRFQRARELIKGFAFAHPSSSLGLVAMAETAAVLCPPSEDHAAFLESLAALKVGELGEGSALGMGLGTATLHLLASRAPSRHIVLLTDGENNAGEVHPETAARLAREAGIQVFVIGIGSEGQTLLDYTDPHTGQRRHGLFNSHYDEKALAAIAREAGGLWFPAQDVKDFERAFQSLEQSTVKGGRTRVEQETQALYRGLLLVGLGLMVPVLLLRFLFLGGRGSQAHLARAYSHFNNLELPTVIRQIGYATNLARLFFFLALVSALLALLGISWGERRVLSPRSGLDIAIALDISKSMDSEDELPSRLEAAKKSIFYLIENLPQARFSLSIGKGQALVVQPMSEDVLGLKTLLLGLSTSSFASSGTDLEALIDMAQTSFPPSSQGFPHLLLLSDGEALHGSVIAAVDRAVKKGIKISAIGFGSEEGSLLKKDSYRDGKLPEKPLRTRRQTQTLKAVALRGGGRYLDAFTSSRPESLLPWLLSFSSGEGAQLWRIERIERHGFFAALALVFYALGRLALLWRPRR